MKVYRGLKQEGKDDFKRNYSDRFYLNCFTFWAPNKEYAQNFGPNILERDIDPSKFFDLDDENDLDNYTDYFSEDIAPAEQNINFALYLALMGYDGYTRIDSDDGTVTDESEREYVILNKNDKELLEKQHLLVDYGVFTKDNYKNYIYKLMWKVASRYDEDLDDFCVPEIINEHLKELGIDRLIKIDPDYGGKHSITSVNKNKVLELAEKLRNAANKALSERAFVEEFLRIHGKKVLSESIFVRDFLKVLI